MDYNKNYNKYQNDYKQKNYDRLMVLLPKSTKEVIKLHADKLGLSLSMYAYKAIREKIERDSISDPDSTDSE